MHHLLSLLGGNESRLESETIYFIEMTKFYTNIEIRGNNILYIGYENGLPVKQKIAYKPHLFIPAQSESKYKSFNGNRPLQRVDFESISDMKSYMDTYSDVKNFEIFGCSDIVRQFTATTFMGDIEWDYSHAKIWFIDIETRVEGLKTSADHEFEIRLDSKTKTASYKTVMNLLDTDTMFEINDGNSFVPIKESKFYVAGFPEPTLAEQEITLISMMNHHEKKMYLFSTIDAKPTKDMLEWDVEYHIHQNEKDMLKDFIVFWKTNRIDIVSGWNSDPFDIPYLVNRMKKVIGDALTNFLSPWGVIKERKYFVNDKQISTYDILGVTHLDYLEIYKKFNPGSKESFKLDFIAHHELSENKVENPTDNFRDFYLKYPDIFIQYNLIDVRLLHKLELKLLQVRLAMQLAYLAKCNINDVVSSMRLWESIIYNYFLDLNIVEDLTKKSNKRESIVGAYVHEPKKGKYGWSVSLDFSSLYPSIMMQNNISPETVIGKVDFDIESILAGKHIGHVPEGAIMSCNGLLTSKKEKGFIPILVKRMFDLRKKTKNKMLELKKEQQEIKKKLAALGVVVE
jgi:hypothetical protein